jgi:putative beta-lysine N-acetyltransferase
MNNKRDFLENYNFSLIQHGKLNDRIYLVKLAEEDYPEIIVALDDLAQKNNYTKVLAKVPAGFKDGFLAQGYNTEAFIPSFYLGQEGASFLGKYFSSSRAEEQHEETLKAVLQVALKKAATAPQSVTALPPGFSYALAQQDDAMEMAQLYRAVFNTYPFPIDEPQYILTTMKENLLYFSIHHKGKLVALASSEMDSEAQNVEMTDFATLPGYTGQGLASYLLNKMEIEMQKRGFKTAYTIARAYSYGMNVTFAKRSYHYGGTLFNNTNIGGQIESMNVWYRSLTAAEDKADQF